MRCCRVTSARRLAWLAATCISLGSMALAAPARADTARSSVTMFSDTGDYLGGGQPRLFDSNNASITAHGSAGYLTVSVSGGTKGDSYNMEFAAPSGQTLAPGVYDGASVPRFEVRPVRASTSTGTVEHAMKTAAASKSATWPSMPVARPVASGSSTSSTARADIRRCSARFASASPSRVPRRWSPP